MNNWKEVSLKNYCRSQYGYTASASDNNTGVKFVRITDIVPDFINWDEVPFCEISKNNYEKYKLNEGDIVVARTGATVGYAKQIRSDSPNSVFASYLVKLIPSKEIDKKFLGTLLESNVYKEFIQTIAGGSAQPNANAKDLTMFKFFLPPLPSQQNIAAILSAYKDLIALNNQRIKLLKETALEVYKEWFVRMRFPGYKHVKFEKGKPVSIGEIKYFREFIKLNRGFDLPESRIKEGHYPVIASTSIKAYHNQWKVKAPIITTGRSGSLGTVLYVNKDGWPLNTSLYVKDFKGNNPLYVFFTLKQLDFESFNSGAGVPSLNQNHLHKLKLWIADAKLQSKFNEVVDPIFQQIEILQIQNTELQQIRDRLLPRLISGKLQVKTQELKTNIPEASGGQAPAAKGSSKTNPYFQRRVLAAYIIDHLKDEPTFGHVKLMKLMYLCEHLAEIETTSHYHRDAAGPYDNQMMRSIDSQLKKAQWFNCTKTGSKYTYSPLVKMEEYKNWFTKYYKDKETGIESLLNIFGKEKTEKAEMVATLYEACRHLQDKKHICSNETIVYEVLHNWHESKQRITEERWKICLQWMKEKGWVNY